jgi:hypothetical protein
VKDLVDREHLLHCTKSGETTALARVEYRDAKADVLLEANLNDLPQRQKLSGAAPCGC